MNKKVFVFIKAEGWDGYTGPLGGYRFQDGVSEDPIPLRAALRIGATLEVVDEEGVRLHPSSYPANESPSAIEAPVIHFPTEAEVPQPVYEPETVDAEETVEIDLAPTREVVGGKIKESYSRAQLEAIADKRGIDGLREIADKLGVKGRSVAELIERIGGAQA